MAYSMHREPCPDRIIADAGGAFAMGFIGNSVYNLIKGAKNAPRGARLAGGFEAARMNAPRFGGSFAVWGALFSTADCALVFARNKEDPWNSIIAGGVTSGILALRQGPRVVFRATLVGAGLLALMEGINIVVNKGIQSMNDKLQAQAQAQAEQVLASQQPAVIGYEPEVKAKAEMEMETMRSKGFAWLGGLFGRGKKEGSDDGSSKTKVLDSFDSPPPMPTFEYK